MVTAASVPDRNGGRRVLDRLRVADGGYTGRLIGWVRRVLRVVLEIVRKPEDQRGFVVLPRRWVLERTLSRLVRCRRLVRDYERLPTTRRWSHEP